MSLLRIVRRLRDSWSLCRELSRAGVTTPSLVLFPLRRRVRLPYHSITLHNGLTLASPAAEPLLDLFREVWINRVYAPFPVSIPEQSWVVDIGANVGVFALWAAQKLRASRMVCVEPSPRVFAFLTRNLRRNGLHDVTALPVACSGRSGEAMLYSRGPEDAMNSLYSKDVFGSQFRALGSVPVMTLEGVFDRVGAQRCSLLKLDCEGAEYEILLGASGHILDRIDRIAMEYHLGLNEYQPGNLSSFLQGHGFRVDIGDSTDGEAGYMYAWR